MTSHPHSRSGMASATPRGTTRVLNGTARLSLFASATSGRDKDARSFRCTLLPSASKPSRPSRALAGFASVSADVGETVTATITLPRRAFEIWDEQSGNWCYRPGSYDVHVGASSADCRLALRHRGAKLKSSSTFRVIAGAVALAVLWPVVSSAEPRTDTSGVVIESHEVSRSVAASADCGPGSRPETGMQGDVTAADRNSGRSTQGYSCNLSLSGGFAGRGAGIVSAGFDHCAYLGTIFPGNLLGPAPGVQVLDVSDPANPLPTVGLTEPAMLAGTWESLKVHPAENYW